MSTVAQVAAAASLAAPDELRERVGQVADERARVSDALRRAGWSFPASDANFIWLPTGSELRSELMDAFAAADILIRSYPAPNEGVRITLADRAANDRVLAVLEHHARFGSQR